METSSPTADPMNFSDRMDTNETYVYNLNGSLAKDSNKNIRDIEYNILNLPSKAIFGDGNSVSYVYAADGKKLQTVHIINGTTTTTDYVGNMIYENGILKRILVDGGYYENDGYYFYIQDHLGNNRVVAKEDGSVIQTSEYYPFGMTFAESTSTDAQPYKYNGKELDTKGGLNLYDYGARHYDPAIARFGTMDPMAEKYYGWAPYVYCLNNPVNLIDPDGKASQYPPGGGTRVHMGFTNWSPEKITRVGSLAQQTNTAGGQVFAGSSISLTGSVKAVGSSFSLGTVGAKVEVGIGNLSVGTNGTELATTTSLAKGEYGATIGSATLKTEATLGEAKGVIGGKNEGIGVTAFSASSKIQVGDNTNTGLDTGGNISAGIKAGPVEANFSMNLKAAGEWISGAIQTIVEMFTPEIIIRTEDKR